MVSYENKIKAFLPEEISSMVLTKMKETAESYLGNKVTDVVITVPAYFNDSQRQATKDAGIIAGLNVLRILNEPTAAAIAYGMDKKISEAKNVLVYDLGGGTFDVSIVTIGDGIFQVRATAGERHLGGEDFNNRMIDWFVKDFRKKHGKDLTTSKRAMTRLRTVCERAKRALSVNKQASIEVDSLMDGIDYYTSITRAKFEDLCIDLFKSTIRPVERALEDGKIAKAEVDDVILVGGSIRIPKIQALLQYYFEGKELNKSINPDEAVAYGAALQAACLPECKNEAAPDLLLIDVTPLSLGIEITAGRMIVIITRNSTLPVKQQKLFTTSFENQQNVSFKVYEGERTFTKDNNYLGEFMLSGIPPAPKGVPEIQVIFNVDNNGILNVSATDSATGVENKVTLKSDIGRHSHKDIEKMIRDAERFKIQDNEQSKRIQLKNSLESYVYNIKSTTEDNRVKEKINSEEAAALYEQCQETLEWLDENQVSPCIPCLFFIFAGAKLQYPHSFLSSAALQPP